MCDSHVATIPFNRPNRVRRRGLAMREVLMIATVLVLLGLFFYASRLVNRPHKLAMRAVCASNLRGIGQAMTIYANDFGGSFPRHYFEVEPPSEATPGRHGVSWIGSMGSHNDLRISQATSTTLSPKRSHPSRSLFMLISGGQVTPGVFICPESGDMEDPLKNLGSDALSGTAPTRPGIDRFDFRGWDSLSYGFQIPYGPAERLDSRALANKLAELPLMADKGPYFETGIDAIRDTLTTSDRATTVAFPANWWNMTQSQLMDLPNDAWGPFNSPNHNGDGQQILYADQHCDFQRRPTVGLEKDNIYTINPRPGDAAAGMLGLRPVDAPLDGPISNTDSYIVP